MLTIQDVEDAGFAFIEELGRFVHVDGDEVGNAILNGEISVEDAKARMRAAHRRSQRMEVGSTQHRRES